MKTVKTFPFLFLLALGLSNNLHAKPKTDPAREKARCDADVDLCDQVAQDDYNHCVGGGQSHCSDNYYEDINQCTSDYNGCLKGISAIKGAAGLGSAVSVSGAVLAQ